MGIKLKDLEKIIDEKIEAAFQRHKAAPAIDLGKGTITTEKLEIEPSEKLGNLSDAELKELANKVDKDIEPENEPYNCPKCGHQEDHAFDPCPQCGAKLSWD